MKQLYLDTNIFIYFTDNDSPFHSTCQKLIKFCYTKNINLLTSVETFQEIIHLAKNTKQLEKGIKIAKNTLEIVSQIFPVNEQTISIYLDAAEKYQSSGSRDLIHLSSCLENKIDHLVTYDSDFKKFKQLKILTPEQILSSIWDISSP